MLRFTVRDLLWLAVVIVVGTAVFVTRSGREHERQAVIQRASQQELEAIGARYRAAKGEFESHVTLWHSAASERLFDNASSIDRTCGAIERFAQATETSKDLETQLKDLNAALELAQYLFSTVREKNADYDIWPIYRIQYTQAGIEARLRRAELNPRAAQTAR